MKKTLPIFLGTAAIVAGAVFAISQANQEISTNNLTPQSTQFQNPISDSEPSELTIFSFNIRDIRGTERTLEDFQELARLMSGADIVVFQEMGAKGFGSSGNNDQMLERLHAVGTVLEAFFGEEWEFVFADSPTPAEIGPAAEIPCIGYRTKRDGLSINAKWSGYYDLGTARDMGTFEVTCKKAGQSEVFTIGSAHTKPTCPQRGEELLRIANYIEDHEDDNYIIMGDLNWGYYSTCTNKYEGEERIEELHSSGTVFQVFHAISYTGKGKTDDFRTNLDVRSTSQMYDQFLVCKNYSDKLADGGILGEDCGFIAYSQNDYFEDRVDDLINDQLKGVKAYMKSKGFSTSSPETKSALQETEAHIRSKSLILDEATYKMSDHKPIWMRLSLFE
ncbi:hypothetical protein N9089_04165 [Crocinitomicaceae bacterium]|nr:hypothetical protein [Crocinitomicaceae bacterium]